MFINNLNSAINLCVRFSIALIGFEKDVSRLQLHLSKNFPEFEAFQLVQADTDARVLHVLLKDMGCNYVTGRKKTHIKIIKAIWLKSLNVIQGCRLSCRQPVVHSWRCIRGHIIKATNLYTSNQSD